MVYPMASVPNVVMLLAVGSTAGKDTAVAVPTIDDGVALPFRRGFVALPLQSIRRARSASRQGQNRVIDPSH